MAAHVRLGIYDVTGREVARLLDARTEPGNHSLTWRTTDVPAGMYFVRLQAPDIALTRRVARIE